MSTATATLTTGYMITSAPTILTSSCKWHNLIPRELFSWKMLARQPPTFFSISHARATEQHSPKDYIYTMHVLWQTCRLMNRFRSGAQLSVYHFPHARHAVLSTCHRSIALGLLALVSYYQLLLSQGHDSDNSATTQPILREVHWHNAGVPSTDHANWFHTISFPSAGPISTYPLTQSLLSRSPGIVIIMGTHRTKTKDPSKKLSRRTTHTHRVVILWSPKVRRYLPNLAEDKAAAGIA